MSDFCVVVSRRYRNWRPFRRIILAISLECMDFVFVGEKSQLIGLYMESTKCRRKGVKVNVLSGVKSDE